MSVLYDIFSESVLSRIVEVRALCHVVLDQTGTTSVSLSICVPRFRIATDFGSRTSDPAKATSF